MLHKSMILAAIIAMAPTFALAQNAASSAPAPRVLSNLSRASAADVDTIGADVAKPADEGAYPAPAKGAKARTSATGKGSTPSKAASVKAAPKAKTAAKVSGAKPAAKVTTAKAANGKGVTAKTASAKAASAKVANAKQIARAKAIRAKASAQKTGVKAKKQKVPMTT